MAAPANLVTPKVEKLHWNDLTQEFELKITFELKTPLGNYPIEYKLTFTDLLSAVQAVINIWSGVSPTIDNNALQFPLGDTAAFTAFATNFAGLTHVQDVPTVPPGYSDLAGWTGPAVPWDGASQTPPWGHAP